MFGPCMPSCLPRLTGPLVQENDETCDWPLLQSNITLLKITWRLESRKSFALNKLITRNNEIDRRKKNHMQYEDLLPTALKTPGGAPPTAPCAVHSPADVSHAPVEDTSLRDGGLQDDVPQIASVSKGKENLRSPTLR